VKSFNVISLFFDRYIILILCQSSSILTEQCNQELILIDPAVNEHKNSSSNLKLKDFKRRDYVSLACWKHLVQLKISNSALCELEEKALPENVKILDLSNNKISDIKQRAFNKLYQLIDLNLSDNIIQAIDQYIFCDLDNLQELNIKNNQITKFNIIFCIKTPQFYALDLSGNQLKYFSDQSVIRWSGYENENQMFSLKKLDLSSNPNLKLASDSFSGSNEMTHLYLHGINSIPSKAELILPLVNLEELSIGHNQQQYLDCSYLPQLLNLKLLQINGKNITQIFCSKTNLPNLSTINLTKNSIDDYNFQKLKEELKAIGVTLQEHDMRIETNSNNNYNGSSMLIIGVLSLLVAMLLICVLFMLYCLLKIPSSMVQKSSTPANHDLDSTDTDGTPQISSASVKRFVKQRTLEQAPNNESTNTENDGNIIYSTIVHQNINSPAQSESNVIYGFIDDNTNKPSESRIKSPAKQGQKQKKDEDSVIYAQINF
jgi:Leucine-rich repeat (LRR) protein